MVQNELSGVMIYHGTTNLGDAVQTYAMCRLLSHSVVGVYRHELDKFPGTTILNGWLGHEVYEQPIRARFAGIFIGSNHQALTGWVARSIRLNGGIIGMRSPDQNRFYDNFALPCFFMGCPTSTLPKYTGPRSGELDVDWPDSESGLTNEIHRDTSWEDQWWLAKRLIDKLKTAELVRTTRLHVVLPCLAMGTPFIFRKPNSTLWDDVPSRWSIIERLGLPEDTVINHFPDEPRQRYLWWFKAVTGLIPQDNEDPDMPIPWG